MSFTPEELRMLRLSDQAEVASTHDERAHAMALRRLRRERKAIPQRRGAVPGLAERLRERRMSQDWSQDDLSAEVHEVGGRLTRLEISRYETGAATPGPLALLHLSRALRCSADWLLAGGSLV